MDSELVVRCNMNHVALKAIVECNFLHDNDKDFDLLWGEICHHEEVYAELKSLLPNQRCNHFIGHGELTRKDLLAKNIKRLQNEYNSWWKLYQRHEKEMSSWRARLSSHDSGELQMARKLVSCEKCILQAKRCNLHNLLLADIIPKSYVLPVESAIFLDAYRKKNCFWIAKPAGRSQGAGIFVFDQLKPSTMKLLSKKDHFYTHIDVLVTSYAPLEAYIYRDGFARFATDEYTSGDIDNIYAHLTNVSINKSSSDIQNGDTYKLSLSTLRRLLNAQYSSEIIDIVFESIEHAIEVSLLAVNDRIGFSPNCFELLGYDVLLTEELKPIIIEANASPSMSASSESDRMLKQSVIVDLIHLFWPTIQGKHSNRHVYSGIRTTEPPASRDNDIFFDNTLCCKDNTKAICTSQPKTQYSVGGFDLLIRTVSSQGLFSNIQYTRSSGGILKYSPLGLEYNSYYILQLTRTQREEGLVLG